MKKISVLVASVAVGLLFVNVNAQSAEGDWTAKRNPTVDSINAKYKDKEVSTQFSLTSDMVYPVLGEYTAAPVIDGNEAAANVETTTDVAAAPQVRIVLDEANKGMIWVEGLPQGKFKAYLMKSPSTYKIPAQKLENEAELEEGTLIYDKDNNQLHIVIGKAYNMENPAAAFEIVEAEPVEKTPAKKTKITNAKAKKEPFHFMGKKINKEVPAEKAETSPMENPIEQ